MFFKDKQKWAWLQHVKRGPRNFYPLANNFVEPFVIVYY